MVVAIDLLASLVDGPSEVVGSGCGRIWVALAVLGGVLGRRLVEG